MEENLHYEETPIIEPAKPRSSLGATLGTTLLFVVLFSVGVGLSVVLRQWLASRSLPAASTTTNPSPTPSPTPYVNVLISPIASPTAAIADSYTGWNMHQVISGVSFKLPPDVLSPICDGASCASQGAYLPNGSRFTVAPRGKGHLLVDARGNIVITDSSGKSFTTKQITLTGGRKVLEYTGLFSGTTVGGYTFSQMRGLMIEIDEDETLEMNHFTPSGVSADFAKDDALFDKIVASLTVATGR